MPILRINEIYVKNQVITDVLTQRNNIYNKEVRKYLGELKIKENTCKGYFVNVKI
jgi:hypothetical protein